MQSGPSLVETVVLGAIQGITEFLPISSDGHLALAQRFFGHEPSLALTVLLHAGTLAATLIVLRDRVFSAVREAFAALSAPSTLQASQGGRDAVAVLIATIPTGIVGLALKHSVEAWSDSPTIIGLCLLGTTAAVLLASRAPEGRRTEPTLGAAALIGVAQGLAALPGLSRSACTIAALLWAGVARPRAFELSFLLSLPAVAGALLLEGRKAFGGGSDPVNLLVGTLVSFAFGVVALLALRRILSAGRFAFFAVYLVPLALACLAWGHAAP